MMGAKFKIGDRVTTNDTTNVDIIQHWNDWFRGEHGEIVDGALVVASVSDKHIGLSNRAGAAHFYMPPSTLTIAPLTIRAGAYYRTRDGRKVGPAEAIGAGKFCWNVPHGQTYYGYTADGQSCFPVALDDLIAEWVDEPAADAKVAGSNDNGTAGFTIPVEDGWYATELGRAYADGYAAGLKAGSEESDSKLKVTIEADTSLLDDEIDRVLSRLKKLNKKALKSGVMLNFSELQDAT